MYPDTRRLVLLSVGLFIGAVAVGAGVAFLIWRLL